MRGRNRRRGLHVGRSAPWKVTVARKGGSRKRSRRIIVPGVRTVRALVRKVTR